jgi:hypothetical protein
MIFIPHIDNNVVPPRKGYNQPPYREQTLPQVPACICEYPRGSWTEVHYEHDAISYKLTVLKGEIIVKALRESESRLILTMPNTP